MKGICTGCDDPCNVVAIDFGIGRYEYWGSKEVDIDIQAVSDCCHEPTVDELNNIFTLNDLARDEY